MTDLTLGELKDDKKRLSKLLVSAQKEIENAQIQYWRYQGALSYVDDNIKKLEEQEVADDREGTDN